MIGYIQGKVVCIENDTLILNVRGLGYELHCTTSTLERATQSDVIELWVHTHVREDALQLFGFQNRKEKQLFLSLIKISGIGPKSAMHILSATTIETLLQMIEEGNAKALSQLPKVGKKTAEQMILSLKGKLVFAEEASAQTRFVARDEIVSALVHLGFKMADVERVVESMSPDTDIQGGVRRGLALLTHSI